MEERRREEEERRQREELIRKQVKNDKRDIFCLIMETATTNRLWNSHQYLRDNQFWSKKAEFADSVKLSEKFVYLYSDFRQNNQNPIHP